VRCDVTIKRLMLWVWRCVGGWWWHPERFRAQFEFIGPEQCPRINQVRSSGDELMGRSVGDEVCSRRATQRGHLISRQPTRAARDNRGARGEGGTLCPPPPSSPPGISERWSGNQIRCKFRRLMSVCLVSRISLPRRMTSYPHRRRPTHKLMMRRASPWVGRGGSPRDLEPREKAECELQHTPICRQSHTP